jgi:hypothetical protein
MYILTIDWYWQRTDPTFHQRGHYKITSQQLSKENLKEREELVASPRWAPDTKTDWPLTVGGNVTLTLDTPVTILNYSLLYGTLTNTQLQYTALSLLHHALHMHEVLSVCCPTPVLWRRLSMADAPLAGFPNYPLATATATHSALILNFLLLLSGAVSNNWLTYCWSWSKSVIEQSSKR